MAPGKYGWLVTTRNHRFEVAEEEGGSCFVARFADITRATEVAAQANEALALGGIGAGKELVKASTPIWWMDPGLVEMPPPYEPIVCDGGTYSRSILSDPLTVEDIMAIYEDTEPAQ